MKIVDFINKHITHNRDRIEDGRPGDYGIRVILHIPVGFLIGLFLLDKELFLKYETNEDKWVKDEAWKDIAGAMIGYVPGRITAIIILVLVAVFLYKILT